MSVKVPVFLGYVQQDPCYNPLIPDKIKKADCENIEVVEFRDTDFTFRRCSKNKRKSVSKWGHDVRNGNQPPAINQEIPKKIEEWLFKNFG